MSWSRRENVDHSTLEKVPLSQSKSNRCLSLIHLPKTSSRYCPQGTLHGGKGLNTTHLLFKMVKSEVEVDRPELSLRESVFLATFKMFLMCRCSKCFSCTIKFRFARSTESNFAFCCNFKFPHDIIKLYRNYKILESLRKRQNCKINTRLILKYQ